MPKPTIPPLHERDLIPADIPEIARALGCSDMSRDLADVLTSKGYPVSYQTIHNWAAGATEPSQARWARVCEILRPLLAREAAKGAVQS